MKIVNIFEYKLFAFHYDGEEDNEYDRLMELWNDTEYVRDFLKENETDLEEWQTIKQFIGFIRTNANEIDQRLIEITKSDKSSLSNFFQTLENNEYQYQILSKQKGKNHSLRFYALKIDEEVFVITGGAIKLPRHHLMEHRDHTNKELEKINRAKDFLKAQDVFDEDSFFEFLTEDCHD